MSDEAIKKNISNNLKALMEGQELSVSDLAAEIRVSGQQIYKWLKGVVMPSAISLYRLAAFFEADMEYFMGEGWFF